MAGIGKVLNLLSHQIDRGAGHAEHVHGAPKAAAPAGGGGDTFVRRRRSSKGKLIIETVHKKGKAFAQTKTGKASWLGVRSTAKGQGQVIASAMTQGNQSNSDRQRYRQEARAAVDHATEHRQRISALVEAVSPRTRG